MPTYNFQCPGCQATLKSANPVEPGKRIKCPKCETVFQIAAAPPPVAVVPKRAPGPGVQKRSRPEDDSDEEPPRRRRSRRDEEDEEDDYEEDRPRPRRKKRRRKAASSGMTLWLVLGGVGLLVLIGGGVAIVWMLGGFTQPRIVGSWVLDNPFAKDAIRYEFRGDGTFTQTINFGGRIEITGTYTVSGNTLTLALAPNQLGLNLQAGQVRMQIESMSATELVLSGPGQFGQQGRMVLKRVQ